MPRGITPRQPSRSGRQDKVSVAATRAKERIAKSSASKAQPSKTGSDGAPAKASSKSRVKSPATTSRKAAIATKGYNPLARERVQAILDHLDGTGNLGQS